MGIGYIPPMKDYYTRVLYSSQINLATYHIMMVKPRGSVISRGLLAPFSSTVWIAMAVFFLLMGPVIYAAIVFHREFGKDEKIVTLIQIIWHKGIVSILHQLMVIGIIKTPQVIFKHEIHYRFNQNFVRNLVDICYDPHNFLYCQFGSLFSKIGVSI